MILVKKIIDIDNNPSELPSVNYPVSFTPPVDFYLVAIAFNKDPNPYWGLFSAIYLSSEITKRDVCHF